jgi:hypothetical protein
MLLHILPLHLIVATVTTVLIDIDPLNGICVGVLVFSA